MDCSYYRTLLMDYEHDELDAARDAAVHKHIQSCVGCREVLGAERELSDSLRAAFGSEFDLPTSVVAGVRQTMHEQKAASFLEKVRAMLRPGLVAPVAAAILIAAVGLLRLDQTRLSTPEFSANYFVRQHVAQTLGSPLSDRAWAGYLLTTANAEKSSNGATSPDS